MIGRLRGNDVIPNAARALFGGMRRRGREKKKGQVSILHLMILFSSASIFLFSLRSLFILFSIRLLAWQTADSPIPK